MESPIIDDPILDQSDHTVAHWNPIEPAMT